MNFVCLSRRSGKGVSHFAVLAPDWPAQPRYRSEFTIFNQYVSGCIFFFAGGRLVFLAPSYLWIALKFNFQITGSTADSLERLPLHFFGELFSPLHWKNAFQ